MQGMCRTAIWADLEKKSPLQSFQFQANWILNISCFEGGLLFTNFNNELKTEDKLCLKCHMFETLLRVFCFFPIAKL